MTAHGASVGEEDIRAAVYAEAAAIDGKDFDAWLDMLTDDVLYWMPLRRGQQEADAYNALYFEDRLLLQVRVQRLQDGTAFSQSPPSWCQHVLQQPKVTAMDPAMNVYASETPFIYVEAQQDSQFLLAGVLHHAFVLDGARLRIRRKRIELLNREAALPSIQLFP